MSAEKRDTPRGPTATELHEQAITCSECGHLHFDPIANTYSECPLVGEGCTCPMSPREYDWPPDGAA